MKKKERTPPLRLKKNFYIPWSNVIFDALLVARWVRGLFNVLKVNLLVIEFI